MSPASLLSACLAFVALPLFAAGEGTAPNTVELEPIPPVEWKAGIWPGEEEPPSLNGWKLENEKAVWSYGGWRNVLYAEKDGRRVLLQATTGRFYPWGTVGDCWLLGEDSFFVVHAPKDGRPPRVVWCWTPKDRSERDFEVESAALQGDGLDVVLAVRPWNADDDTEPEMRALHIPLDPPAELDVESTDSEELPGMGIAHLPETRVSQDGRWVSVSYGASYTACAVDVERQMVSRISDAWVDAVHGGWNCSGVVGYAWGTEGCPAPRFLADGSYGRQSDSSVQSDGLADVEEADEGCYHFYVGYTRPDGDTLGEFVAERADGEEVRFAIPDSEQVRQCWPDMFKESTYCDSSTGSFGLAAFSLCGDKLLYCGYDGQRGLVTVGPQGVEGEEVLLNDDAVTAARARFGGEVPPIYNASFTHGGALVAWFVAAPESEGSAGRWHVRFYAQDGSIRREYECDVSQLPAGLDPYNEDFLTPQVVGDRVVIVTNADGTGVHYRILSPTGEQDDVLFRSPQQLWFIKAGSWLLGITPGKSDYTDKLHITPSRVHFIPVEISKLKIEN